MICQANKATSSVDTKGPFVPDRVDILPMRDLLVGKAVWDAMCAHRQSESSAVEIVKAMLVGVSVDVCEQIPPDAVIGCTERGREIVRDMKEGQA